MYAQINILADLSASLLTACETVFETKNPGSRILVVTSDAV